MYQNTAVQHPEFINKILLTCPCDEFSVFESQGRLVNAISGYLGYPLVIKEERSLLVDISLGINDYKLGLCNAVVLICAISDIYALFIVFDDEHSGKTNPRVNFLRYSAANSAKLVYFVYLPFFYGFFGMAALNFKYIGIVAFVFALAPRDVGIVNDYCCARKIGVRHNGDR